MIECIDLLTGFKEKIMTSTEHIVNRRCSINDVIICHSCGLVEDGTGLGMKGIFTLGWGHGL